MAKPILIIKINGSLDSTLFDRIKESVGDPKNIQMVKLEHDYHVIITNDYWRGRSGFKFEVLNADKLEDEKILEVIEQLKSKLKVK